MRYLLFTLLCSLSLVAQGDQVTIDKHQLRELGKSYRDFRQAVEEKIQAITRETDDERVIPSHRERRQFRRSMDRLLGTLEEQNFVSPWIKKVLHEGDVEEPVQPVSLQVSGYFIVGKSDTKNYSEAAQDHDRECQNLRAILKNASGQFFSTLQCGGVSNVSQYASIGYSQLASAPVMTVVIPGNLAYDAVGSGNVSGTKDDKNAYVAYASWMESCKSFISRSQRDYGNRFIAAACGSPRNVSQYTSIGYKQYSSSGTVYFAK